MARAAGPMPAHQKECNPDENKRRMLGTSDGMTRQANFKTN